MKRPWAPLYSMKVTAHCGYCHPDLSLARECAAQIFQRGLCAVGDQLTPASRPHAARLLDIQLDTLRPWGSSCTGRCCRFGPPTQCGRRHVDEDAGLQPDTALSVGGELGKMRRFRAQVEVTEEPAGIDKLEMLLLQVRGAKPRAYAARITVFSNPQRPFQLGNSGTSKLN